MWALCSAAIFLALPAVVAPIRTAENVNTALNGTAWAQLDSTSTVCGTAGTSAAGVPIVNGKIVDGVSARECELKWQVGLVQDGKATPFCGGSLISAHWVLTAAHCIQSVRENDVQYHLVLGEYEPSFETGFEQKIEPKKSFIHPDYDSTTVDWDFALVWLKEPAVMSECVGTICLPTEEVEPGTECKISGWGTLSAGGGQSSHLLETTVHIRKKRRCTFPFTGYGNEEITDSMMCAMGEMTSWWFWRRSDACQGDSGGPLVCWNKVTKRWYLQGLTSWGRGCGSWWYPGIYANIVKVRGWIDATMRDPAYIPAPAPPAALDRCPEFAKYSKPDSDGDCSCPANHFCSTNGEDYNCPTSAGIGGHHGGYFLPSCTECKCTPMKR